MKSPTVSVKLDSELRDRVQALAAARRRTPHWIMCDAIEQYVAREEKREQLRQSALAAWADYQATGLHATAEEANAWLVELETKTDPEAPACHR